MILSTFTRLDVIETLHKVAGLLKDRASNFIDYNRKSLIIKLKKEQEVGRVFSCEVSGQRYYERFIYRMEDGQIRTIPQSIITLFNDSRGVFVFLHFPERIGFADYYMRTSLELRIFSGHFVNRFFERTGRDGSNLSLIDKTMVILSQMQSIVGSTVDDNVIRRFGEPSLPFTFLQEGEKEVECSYLNDGDIAIVERYGPVPVWRTYISKEMLFESQHEYINQAEVQEGIRAAKLFSQRMKEYQ